MLKETVATRAAFRAGVKGTRYTENPDPDFDLPVATDNTPGPNETHFEAVECVFHACRSMVSSHARPTFQLMSVRDFTACRSKTTRVDGSCRKVLSASMIVVAERC
jgi:hypothetical protein